MPHIEKFEKTYADGSRLVQFKPKTGGSLRDLDGNLQFGVSIHNGDPKVTLHVTSFTGFNLCAAFGVLDARRLGRALLTAADELEVASL